jgi:phage shock protein A
MSLSKLWTAIRGGFNESTQAVADSQAIRILEQELRDSDDELVKSDQQLASIMGKRKLGESKIASLKADIEKYTQSAIKADAAGDEALALECAERVSELDQLLATEVELMESFKKSEAALKENIKKAKTNVRRMKQQIDQVKATESVQKAQVAVSSHHVNANSKVKSALDSLDRVKARQAQRGAELEAAGELAEMEDGASLDTKLKAAGITPGGAMDPKDKLAQLLNKNKQEA